MSEFKNYIKTVNQPMRPYVPGEDMTGVTIRKGITPEEGGMIAVNPYNDDDKWYIEPESAKGYHPDPNNTPSRVVEIGTKKYTTITAVDAPEYGANHRYLISQTTYQEGENPVLTRIQMQKGPIKEVGVNGCHNEDLIAIVIDRLKGFQNTPFNCEENTKAINHLKTAINTLNSRTKQRRARNVEGTSKI